MALAAATPRPAVLDVVRLTKRFGALAAVNEISFTVHEGETFGIAGPNGAGKTTLFDVISGHARASSGVIAYKGREIQDMSAHLVSRIGLSRTFQVPTVFGSQTIYGNLLLGAYFARRRRVGTGLAFDRESRARARRAADFVGLGGRLGEHSDVLSAYDLKRLMLAIALATEPEVLMLDEPAAGLSDEEIRQVVGLIERVKSSGVTILLIEHVMSVLMSVSDRVMIMHQGTSLCEGCPEEVQVHPDVVRLYLGEVQC